MWLLTPGNGKVIEQHAPWTQDFTQHRERAYKYLSQPQKPYSIRPNCLSQRVWIASLRRNERGIHRGAHRAGPGARLGKGHCGDGQCVVASAVDFDAQLSACHRQVRAHARAGRPERIRINGFAVNRGALPCCRAEPQWGGHRCRNWRLGPVKTDQAGAPQAAGGGGQLTAETVSNRLEKGSGSPPGVNPASVPEAPHQELVTVDMECDAEAAHRLMRTQPHRTLSGWGRDLELRGAVGRCESEGGRCTGQP